ncbi:MAG: carboxypeptidase regulatory-like domain-containing protein [Deltaproteobacteria bacterium]|nr:MAG: carboxypeptidase regulatory-like domain-containing protein [Deltaproteobacteria bacterium]
MSRLLPLWLALSACGGLEELDTETSSEGLESLLRIDVHPPVDANLRDEAGELLTLRPQTFYIEADASSTLDLVLTPAVPVTGRVSGSELTPWSAQDLPEREVVVAGATVGFGLASTIQQPRTTTDEDGLFDLLVVPSTEEYEVTITPATATIPLYRTRMTIGRATPEADIELQSPAPLWGFVRDARGDPMVSANVYVTGSGGLRSASTSTDAEGRFLIAVQADQRYTVVSTGRGPLDPTVRIDAGVIAPEGARVDIPAGQLQPRGTVTGTVRGPGGNLVSDSAVRVRVVATELRDLDGAVYSFQREIGTDDGIFTAVVPPGTYRVEVLPQDVEGPAPLAVQAIRNDGVVTDVGTLNLRPLTQRFAEVIDPGGLPVSGAVVTCTEQGFSRRTWSSSSDPSGQVLITSPEVPMSCSVSPPGGRRDLATTRQAIGESLLEDPEGSWTFQLVEGVVVRGVVSSRLAPELTSTDIEGLPAALVEVRDGNDRLLGSSVTSSTGAFQIRIAR